MVKHITRCGKILACAIITGIIIAGGKNCHAALSTVSKASVMVSTACSMTATVNTLHGTNIVLGQTKEDIGLTTISTNCNDQAGFAIYAAGFTGNQIATATSTALVGEETGIVIPTGLTDVSSDWAMKVSSVAGNTYPAIIDNNYNEYHEVPANFTRVAYREAATGSGTAGASQITTTYRAYIAPTQAADIYTGQVRYVLVHPRSNIPTLDFDSAFAAAGVTAKYKVNDADEESYYAMQNMTSAICNSVVEYNAETQLIDIRDKKLYWVLKAQDDKCWMTQNLDLDLRTDTAATDFVALTSENTDLNIFEETGPYSANSGYSYENDVITWQPNSATYNILQNANSNTAPRSWNLTIDGKDVYQKGTTFASATCNYMTDAANCVGADKTFNTEPFAENGEHGKLGNYYNWTAAIATNDSSVLSENTYSNIVMNPNNSICPKGWRLTRSASDDTYNDFKHLYSNYNSSRNLLLYSPLWLVRAGGVFSSSLNYSGSSGHYWSSTVYSSTYAYNLLMGSGSFYPSGTNGYVRSLGFSVRCVAR